MGLDCVVQGLIITVLVLASFFVGVYFDMGYIHIADMIAGNADEEGVMMAFITLNMVEIFHCFNMRRRSRLARAPVVFFFALALALPTNASQHHKSQLSRYFKSKRAGRAKP